MKRTRLRTPAFFLVGVAALGALPARAQTSAPPPAASAEYAQGRASYERKEYERASAHFQRAASLAPDRSEYEQWLGRAFGLQAQNASLLARPGLALHSCKALERAVELDPANLGARSDLAAYYAAAPGFLGGSTEKARTQVAEIRRRDPYLGQLRAGDLLWDDHHFAEAETAFQDAVRMDPHRPEAHARLGTYYLQQKQYTRAFAQWDDLLSAGPAHPRALYGLGKTAALSGQRTEDGENSLRTFLRSPPAEPDPDGPSPARAPLYLGRLLERRGDRHGARSEYETALRLDPGLTEAAGALSDLKP